MRLLDSFSVCTVMRQRLWQMFGMLLALLVLSGPVLAENEPFQMEPSSWMSFDRYKEKPSTWIAPDDRAQAEQIPVVAPPPVTPPDMPTITRPTQPVVLPGMPGMNRDFDVKIDSTEDDSRAAGLPNLDDKSSDNWQDAVKTARLTKKQQALGNGTDHPALDVRFSYLPSWVTPARKTVPVKPAAKKIEVAQPKPEPPPAPKADAVACAAIDAYKKHQLAAIQSDRKTLDALQNAISKLGLDKELDFMTGSAGSLNTSNAGSPNIDLPVVAPSSKN